jgi:methylenetetrahydrofolate dehydrogenase (NADP+)/methenyltetrahydrofolate cyclohydrolase
VRTQRITLKRRQKRMSTIIDGKKISEMVRQEYAEEIKRLAGMGVVPGLAVIIVGDDAPSKIYVRNKGIACQQVGIHSEIIEMPEETEQSELIEKIQQLNERKDIDGILVQVPLPKHINPEVVVASISPDKDVDAFSEINVGKIMIGRQRFLPCTPAGVIELLKRYNIEISGKECVMVDRSDIVGKPMAMLLMQNDGTVTICHSKTKNLAEITRRADILVVAMKKSRYIKADMVKPGAVVIDVGMNRDENGKLSGDVDFDEVSKVASYITPVPGGVGPMTITMLLKNTITAAKHNHGIE